MPVKARWPARPLARALVLCVAAMLPSLPLSAQV